MSDMGLHNKDLNKSAERILESNTYRDLSTICILPSRGMIPAVVVQGWMALMLPINQKFIYMFVIGREIPDAYNTAIERILANDKYSSWQYVLTIEDDNVVPPDGILKLYENVDKYDVISGLYWTKGEIGQAMIFGNPQDKPINYIPQVPQENTIQETNALGMGFTIFRLDIFKKLSKPWFKNIQEYTEDGKIRINTQDLYFFQNAGREGYKFAVDTRIKVGHYDRDKDIIW